jgi:hypothetical protein
MGQKQKHITYKNFFNYVLAVYKQFFCIYFNVKTPSTEQA